MIRLFGLLKENVTTITNIKEILTKYINFSDYKTIQDTEVSLILKHKSKDMSLDFHLNMAPDQIYMAALAKVEVSSVSLADPRKAYQTTSARRAKHKKVSVRGYFDSVESMENKLKAFFKKIN